jgi:hypothetical protein
MGMIINPYAFGVAFDADAQAFITASGISDSTQQNAINTLVTDLKGYGIWTKMKAIYPFVGGTASTHKWNLKDPRDLDAAFRLTFSGGWTHSNTGMLGNAINSYAQTYAKSSTEMSVGSGHMSFYSRSSGLAGQTEYEMGNYAGAGYTVIAVRNNNIFYGDINTTALPISVSNTDGKGFYIAARTSSTAVFGQKNTTQTTSTGVEANSAGTFVIGAVGTLSTPQFSSGKECAFASIGTGLSTTEATNFYTAVQAFQTTLGRQV